MNRIFKSIRWRLQIWHGLILLLVLAAFSCTAYLLAKDNRQRRIDQELQRQASALMDHLRPLDPPFRGRGFGPPGFFPQKPGHGERGFGGRMEGDPRNPAKTIDFLDIERQGLRQGTSSASFFFAVWSPDEKLMHRSAGAPETIVMPGNELVPLEPVIRTVGELRELMQVNRRGYRILVGHDLAPDQAELELLALRLGMAAFAVLGVGLACGWWLASRAIQPIRSISITAEKIAAGNLSERINLKETDDEFGQLAGVLNTTFTRLEAAFARQSRFTADASHELRTPVSVVLSQTQLALSRERSAAEYQQSLQVCQRAAKKMRQLIESLLVLARLDSAGEHLKREACDLKAVIEDVLEMLRPIAAEHRVKIDAALNSITFIGQAGQLSQVITNLAANAIFYNKPGGEVRVGLGEDDLAVEITISDTGQGIAAEDLPHIFDRFYRADKARGGSEGHTGLGLAIARSIVESHRGSISVMSELNVGTCFVVRLPRVAVDPTLR